ncbi:hypothetical protein CHLNCDRAFT_49457 [Chlorella variabilis]|uniref:Transmembrane protein 208 n=1 Tax=Chlorella variabilis TaxID=554065 RepID=E1Z2G7_CHLVA|nr:hypothetical protein CHLNCDRAFT_49457 [Chlorella variabilis]EFN59661.1 hypothetical protein CHLNCDRAFT_49457 [Chlorella variabilis]|eukprot:XP_005851763.1 hypothetical protein CHLNCDRAFT_49457 [Chlorella variabilis]
MAKGGDKRRLEENRRHLNKLRALVAGANVAFLVIRLLFRRSSAGKLLWAGWLLSGVICNVAYYMISQSLSPVYGPSGELVYSGQDLSVGGVLSYMHDVLYISLFVQLAGCATDWAWLTFLLIPAYALYMLAVNVLIPYWNTPKLRDMPETEADRKRREKRERQSARAAKFGGR